MSDPTDCKNCGHTVKDHRLNPFGVQCDGADKKCKCKRYEPVNPPEPA